MIPKDEFLRSPIKQANELGPGHFGWQKDMERAFFQIPLDPLFWSLLGIMLMNLIFFQKTIVMGCHSAPYACQRTTNAIRHFMLNMSYVVFNYIDDFMSIDNQTHAWKSFNAMAALLRDLGVCEAIDKSVPPIHIIEFLGILFDLLRMIICLPEEKLKDIRKVLQRWETHMYMTKKQLQSVARKLQFAACCIQPGRVFISRLYDTIATLKSHKHYPVFDEVHKDLKWRKQFRNMHNGASIMWMTQHETVNEFMSSDASLEGIGAFCKGSYFHIEIPQDIRNIPGVHIAHFELWAIIAAVKTWKQQINGCKFVMGCDNLAMATIVNTGRSRDKLLQKLLQELIYVIAMNQAEIVTRFVPSGENVIPDLLSRMTIDRKYRKKFYELKQSDWVQENVKEDVFMVENDW